MRQLVSGGLDACVMVWNFKLQLRAFRFVGHKDAVLSVACAPSGNLVASGSKDRTVRLWDVQTGDCVRIFTGHRGGVRSLAMSPDGKSMASGSDDGGVLVWDLATAKCSHAFEGHRGAVYSLDYSHGAGTVLASDGGAPVLAGVRVVLEFVGHAEVVSRVATMLIAASPITALSYVFPSSFQRFWDAVVDPTFTTPALAWGTWGAAPVALVLGAVVGAEAWRGSAARASARTSPRWARGLRTSAARLCSRRLWAGCSQTRSPTSARSSSCCASRTSTSV